MTFIERMRELLNQGVMVSRDFAVKAGAKAQDLGAKAGAKAQDLGERGVLMLEIRQLEGQAQKLIGRLGTETYHILAERGETTVSAESVPIKAILSEITAVRETIEERQAELLSRKEK